MKGKVAKCNTANAINLYRKVDFSAYQNAIKHYYLFFSPFYVELKRTRVLGDWAIFGINQPPFVLKFQTHSHIDRHQIETNINWGKHAHPQRIIVYGYANSKQIDKFSSSAATAASTRIPQWIQSILNSNVNAAFCWHKLQYWFWLCSGYAFASRIIFIDNNDNSVRSRPSLGPIFLAPII